MVDKNAGKISPARSNITRYFHGIIILTALAATFVVVIILSSNLRRPFAATNQTQTSSKDDVSVLRSRLQQSPGDPELNLEMGNQLFDQGNYRESTVYYRRVLAPDSLNVPARIDLGVAYFNLGLSDSALTEMKKSLQIEPKHAKGLFNIGVIYYNMGRNSDARKSWEQLIKEHDGSQEAQIARQMLENIKS